MIIVKIIGGLGNQLFQYALGRAAAYRKNTLLKMDINSFKTYTLHKYALSNFNIIESFATEEEIRNMTNTNGIKYWPSKFKHLFKPYHAKSFVKESDFAFDPNIMNLPTDVYLDGYWQSEKYFYDIRNILLEDFSPLIPFDKKNRQYIESIINVNSISIHVRRRDYISNPQTFSCHGVCDKEYYKSAISFFSNKIKKPHFFIFSDDIEWTKNNFKLNYPAEFMDYNLINNKNCNDLFLMSYCKHNIIANSSFSWWAAWLNRNPNKIVVAPKKWFNDPNINTKDLIPESWLRV